MDTTSAAYWAQAQAIDPTLSRWQNHAKDLRRLQLRPQRYSRSALFDALARQEAILFSDYPLRSTLRRFFHDDNPSLRLKTLFGPRTTTVTKSGRNWTVRTRRVHEMVDIWQRDRGMVFANDIFYRHLKFDKSFDCEAIGDFSVLRHAPARLRELEVATLLMGTTGCLTDSHSDDPDGCNHCIAGRKFWLVWDRLEGAAKGLQDSEYDLLAGNAACRFNVKAFSSLRSARWFTVAPGQTLFLPGNHTHKVITIERYIGISNFYVGLPRPRLVVALENKRHADGDRGALAGDREAAGQPAARNSLSFPGLQTCLGVLSSRRISPSLESKLDGSAENATAIRSSFQDAA